MLATIPIPLSMKKFLLSILLVATSVVVMAQEGVEATEPQAIAEVEQTAHVMLTPNEARAQRGFTSDTNFVPKGQWIFGGSASYSNHKNENYRLAIINDIDSEGYTVKVSPMIAYAPWRNMAVGIRFGYGRSMLALDNAALSLGESLNFAVDYYHQVKHSFVGSLFWRPYIPLGTSNRFAIFAEVQLNFTATQSRLVAENGVVDNYVSYRGTYSESYGGSIALQPGIVAFVTNDIALELSIGVFGIGYDRTKQVQNQVDTGVVSQSNMNFKVNLLSIGFGVSFYL